MTDTSPDLQDNIDLEEDIEFITEDSELAAQKKGDKTKQLREELKEAKSQRDEYLTGWQRAKADAINQKKDYDSRMKSLTQVATIRCVEDFLPVYDSFHMAMKNKQAWEAIEPEWRSGVEYIFQQFNQVLEDNSIAAINQTSVVFDSSLHEPLETREDETQAESDQIIEIKQVGFKTKNMVIRPAKVVVTVLKQK